MGKIDDMRRLRESQVADLETRRAKAAKDKPAKAEEAAPAPKSAPAAPKSEPAPAAPKKKTADATEGKCPECGKVKPVQNGVMASHQKGFGKACAGSRKPPV